MRQKERGFTDALMLDHENNIAEATGANIFFKTKSGRITYSNSRFFFRWYNKKMCH